MHFLKALWRTIAALIQRLLPEKLTWSALPRPLLVMAILGLMLRAGFPPLESRIAPFAALAIFVWYFGKHRHYLTVKAGWWLGFAFGFVYFYTSSFWLHNLIQFNPFILLGVPALGAIMALWLGILGVGMAAVARRAPAWLPLFTASVWTLLEWSHEVGELAFPFFRVAHLFWRTPGNAAVWGELGLTFSTVLLCGCAGFLLLRWWGVPGFFSRRPGIAWLLQTAVGLFVLLLPGALTQPFEGTPTEIRRIALVQPNIEQPRKWAANMALDWPTAQKHGLEILEDTFATVEGLKPEQADLVVFPEATFPGLSLFYMDQLRADVRERAGRVSRRYIVGAEWYDLPGTANERIYNAVWLLDPAREMPLGVYRKRQLVPFGEHVPWLDFIPYFQESIVGIGSFDVGETAGLLHVDSVLKVGILICFESSLGRLARDTAEAGASLLAVTTNDAWFGRSTGLHYHMLFAAFRAAETGLPTVQAANTGLTVAFDRHGRLVSALPPHEPGYLVVELEIPTQTRPGTQHTIYSRWGDAWLWALVLFVAAILTAAWRAPRVLSYY